MLGGHVENMEKGLLVGNAAVDVLDRDCPMRTDFRRAVLAQRSRGQDERVRSRSPDVHEMALARAGGTRHCHGRMRPVRPAINGQYSCLVAPADQEIFRPMCRAVRKLERELLRAVAHGPFSSG